MRHEEDEDQEAAGIETGSKQQAGTNKDKIEAAKPRNGRSALG